MPNSQLEDLVLQLKTVGFGGATTKVDNLTQSVARLNATVAKSTIPLAKQKKIIGENSNAARRYTNTMADANKKITTLEKKLASANKAVAKLKSRRTGFLGLSDSIADAAKKVLLWSVATGAVFATFRAFREGIGVIVEHDQQMINLRKVYSGAESDLAGLRLQTMAVAKAQKTLTNNALEGAVVAARTGRIRQDVIRLTETALIGQNIAELQVADGVKFLNSALIQFNETSTQTIRILDEWNELSNKTPATTQDLAQAVSVAGSVFKQAGSNIQFLNANTAALVAITAKSGNIVGRAERTMAIYAQRQKTVNLLARIGIDVFDRQTKEFIGIDTLLTSVAGKWGTLNDQWRAAIAQSVAGARQQQFFIALMENQDIVVENLTIQWKAFGSAVKENEIFLQSIRKEFEGLIGSLERTAIGIGEGGVSTAIKGLIRLLTILVDNLGTISVAMLAMAAQSGVLTKAFNATSAAVTGMNISFKALFTTVARFLAIFAAIEVGFFVFNKLTSAGNDYAKVQEKINKLQEQQVKLITKTAKEQSRLESIVSQLRSMVAAQDDSTEGLKRAEKILDVLKELYPDLAKGVDTLEDAYKRFNQRLLEQNKLLLEQKSIGVSTQIETLNNAIQRAKDIQESGPLQKTVMFGREPFPITDVKATARRNLKAKETEDALIEQRDQLQSELDDLKLQISQVGQAPDPRGGPGGGPGEGDDINAQIANLERQAEILRMILDGRTQEEVTLARIAQIQERLTNEPLSQLETQRLINQDLQERIKLQNIILQQARQVASIITRGVGDAIASGFESDAVGKAMENIVNSFAGMLSKSVTDSITQSMIASGSSKILSGITGGLAGGLITGIAGLIGNTLFGGGDSGDNKQAEATEENTIQLRALNDNIRDLSSLFINAPANFALPGSSSGFTGPGAAAVASGGPSGGNTSVDRSLNIQSGAINVVAAPGQSEGNVAAEVMSQIRGQYSQGANVEQEF